MINIQKKNDLLQNSVILFLSSFADWFKAKLISNSTRWGCFAYEEIANNSNMKVMLHSNVLGLIISMCWFINTADIWHSFKILGISD